MCEFQDSLIKVDQCVGSPWKHMVSADLQSESHRDVLRMIPSEDGQELPIIHVYTVRALYTFVHSAAAWPECYEL